MSYFFILLIAILSIIFLLEMRHSLRRSNMNSHLIEKYRDDLQNKELLEEIYAYCQHDYKLRRVMQQPRRLKDRLVFPVMNALALGQIVRHFITSVNFGYRTGYERTVGIMRKSRLGGS